jgi:hypothetical protein
MQHLIDRFFSDPQWGQVEDMLLKYVDPLVDMTTVDLKQPAEQVKADIMARILAYNSITKFLNDTKMVGRPIKEITNPFK